MSETMRVLPFEALLRWVLYEWEQSRSVFGIPGALFHTPRPDDAYASQLFGHLLATPIGPAAGPHTQLAQNIVCAWLSGGRFIELKTVQVMDELEIPRPCIDMADEGYNVEWSQELRLEQSADEYVKAWVLIHLLPRILGWDEALRPGTIFNMSVGYNLEGIRSERMTRFMDRLQSPAESLDEIQHVLKARFPQLTSLPSPTPPLTDTVTLSTMHGCPPDEIEAIARYLMEERGLHTTVKLNPTLLGKAAVLDILHERLGFTEIDIPDRVFEHDLQYPRAVGLIRALQDVAARRGLSFGVKLSNTLAMTNHRGILPGDEMYMSGRALYPVTMALFHKLMQEFGGNLHVSYSAGADAFNVATILSCGARPVTVASDLLKPGGYSRLRQYLESLEQEMGRRGAASLDELAGDRLANVAHAAAEALANPRYKKVYFPHGLPKVQSDLGLFDCIVAPCVERCAVGQDVPEYARLIAQGDDDRALDVILARNPLPNITGYVCTQLCQTRCTRNDYEEPVAIRALKRFAAEHGRPAPPSPGSPAASHRVAIIGAGPSGLAAACFLAQSGIHCTIFEAKDSIGGMMRLVPSFRLPDEVIQRDLDRLRSLGVDIRLSHPITRAPEELLAAGFDAVYIACGFQKGSRLEVPGAEGPGVWQAFELLEAARRGRPVNLGATALVIGGGDTAMDAARVARRTTGNPSTIVYRRSRGEMPASVEELSGALEEGNALIELATPVRVIRDQGRVVALECLRNRLGEPGKDGRRSPVPVPGTEFRIAADAIILAIGQQADLAFLDGSRVSLQRNGSIAVDAACGLAAPQGIYAGGDCVDGPESIIAACADGRRAAETIAAQLGVPFASPAAPPVALSEADVLRIKLARARKEPQHRPDTVPPEERRDFGLIEATLSPEAARVEAARCLQCAALCDKCVEVCPNRANLSVRVAPLSLSLPVLSWHEGRLAVTGCEAFGVNQPRQIVHVSDFCNECGNCATFCVHQGRPYADKPRLFLNRADFQKATGTAFYIEGETIHRREAEQECSLTMAADGYLYEDRRVALHLSPQLAVREMLLKQRFEGTLSLRPAAEMAVLLAGARSSALRCFGVSGSANG